MDQNERLQQISTALLNLCLENKRLLGCHIDDLVDNFSNKHEAKDVLKRYLVRMDYVKPSDDKQYYKITALGRAYLSKSSANSVNYSNITNSNIAHQSLNTTQKITMTELPEDLQDLIREFDKATDDKDGDTLKKVFGYIADKSVDVAIALATGALIRL